MKLFVFNPENDLALANNQWNFIAPASARKMRLDLECLPVWWTSSDDCVWVSRNPEHLYFESLNMADRFTVFPAENAVTEIEPWGWSPLMAAQLSEAGVDGALLPDEAGMRALREYSGRAYAVSVLKQLRTAADVHPTWAGSLCGLSFFCTTTEQIDELFRQYPHTLLKAPWSGSGKGLRLGAPRLEAPLEGWCSRQIREQGGVVVEPLYNKVCDLACEFYSDGQGKVYYEGLSLFTTTHQGAYSGNLVASETEKEDVLSEWLDLRLLDWVSCELIHILETGPARVYRGPLGVDMMVCRMDDGEFLLHPCVEINLRMTMGMVALKLEKRLPKGTKGRFYIDYSADSAALNERAREDARQRPPLFHDGKLVSGCLPLTPVYSDTCYRACLEIG